MREFFTIFKDSMFGIVVILWGVAMIVSPALLIEPTLHLLFLTFSQLTLGYFFVAAGVMHVSSKVFPARQYGAISNVLIALVFLLTMLTHLFASVYLIAWVAFAGITISLLINAFLLFTDK